MLFRKDLRLSDNTALIEATKNSEKVFPLFIFDPRQVTDKNKYKSDNALDFMVTSLLELEQECKKKDGVFSCAYEAPEKYLETIFKTGEIEALFFNKDYTPFALHRDEVLQKLCKKYDVECHLYDDGILTVPGSVMTGKKTPYTIFTPFFRQAGKNKIAEPISVSHYKFSSKRLEGSDSVKHIVNELSYTENPNKYVQGGTKEGLKILKHLDDFHSYGKTRDFPELPTTYLAAHIKFGTLSIRQVYHAVVDKAHNAVLLKQLFWRDFYIHVGYHFSHVFKSAFNPKYKDIAWVTNKKNFTAWCEGKTGFPIVDAGMRQVNATGYMHNRVRMIVASFLTKNLHISWQEGERYFAQMLTDYDPAVNNGSWQWAASTGADPQPYFRIFNPWLQQKKFDMDCTYIKKWVPELKDISCKIIHTYYKNKEIIVKNYPLPIVDHATTSAYAKRLFKK